MTRPHDPLSRAGRLADNLPGLLLEAEAVAHSFMRGIHGRRRVGTGEAFWQFRPYQPGDSSRDIDWRQTAKREDAFVRQTEWEAAQTVWLYRDASESMKMPLTQGLPSKKDYAELLLLALGIVLLNGGEQAGLLGADMAPQSGHAAIQRIYERLAAQKDLFEGGQPVSARSHAVLISDFYFPLAELAAFCERLAGRQVRGLLVQVIDPVERTLPYSGRIRFQDPEDGGAEPVVIPHAEVVRAAYEQKFAAHQQALAELAARLGWKFEKFPTDVKPETALSRLYDDLAARK